MKRFLFPLLALAAVLLSESCSKASHNGALDGRWQFMEVAYQQAGRPDSVVNLKNGKVYLSFQCDLAEIFTYTLRIDTTCANFMLRFHKSGKQLRLYNFYRHFRTADSLVTNSQVFCPLGIRDLDVTFDILRLSDQQLVLQDNDARIALRKF